MSAPKPTGFMRGYLAMTGVTVAFLALIAVIGFTLTSIATH